MNDQQRIDDLASRVRALERLDEAAHTRLLRTLEQLAAETGGGDVARPTITVFDARQYELDALEEHNAGRFVLRPLKTPLTAETAGAAAGSVAACVFVNDTCDAPAVEALASIGVKLIALRCSGYNNVDFDACRRHGVDVVRVPAYSPHAVAEHTVALMLMLNRHLHLAYSRNRTGVFTLDGLTGFDMHGKTVGVVGVGAIGECVVKILRGFGCQVLAYDAYPREELAADPGVRYASLDELLAESDIVTLHVPLLDETYHLIDTEAIARMKPGAMLINTSRGGLVDAPALIEGLKSGRVGAAGLDVYEEEAGIFFHDLSDQVLTDDVLARLMSFNNVVVTAHQAFLTREALAAIANATLDSVEEFVAGKRGAELTRSIRLG